MDVSGLNEVGNAANSTANGANAATTTTTSTASTTTAATTSGAVAASNSGVYMQVGKALAESAISTVSSTAAQSAVNGESFSDAIKNQGTNILVGAVSNVGAKHIGMNYKTSAQTGVDKAIQLTSHAALGAGVSALTGNDALSGAVSGVVGEVGGEFIDKNTNLSNNAIKELAGLAGGYSAIFTGNLVGNSDSEVAGNIFSGQRIGKNAAENNYLMPQEKKEFVRELNNCNRDAGCVVETWKKYTAISNPRDQEFKESYESCKNGNCKKFNSIHRDLRMELTEEGNEYFDKNKHEFVKLPSGKDIFHTFKRDSNKDEIMNVITESEKGYTKYVHPIMGYEVVTDADDNIVTDHLNIGTYNMYNPHLGMNNRLLEDNSGFMSYLFGKHSSFDVKPYFDLGNSDQDPTTPIQRKLRIINRLMGKDEK